MSDTKVNNSHDIYDILCFWGCLQTFPLLLVNYSIQSNEDGPALPFLLPYRFVHYKIKKLKCILCSTISHHINSACVSIYCLNFLHSRSQARIKEEGMH